VFGLGGVAGHAENVAIHRGNADGVTSNARGEGIKRL